MNTYVPFNKAITLVILWGVLCASAVIVFSLKDIRDSSNMAAALSAGYIYDYVPVEITHDSATIVWSTLTPSSTELFLGTEVKNLSAVSGTMAPGTYHEILLPNLSSCTRYYYRMSSTDASGIKNMSSVHGFDTKGCGRVTSGDISAPSAPGGLSVSNIQKGIFTLSWTASAESDVAGYEIFGPNGTGVPLRIAKTGKDTLSYTIDRLKKGTYSSALKNNYYTGFYIQAFDVAGNYSAPSGRISVTIPGLEEPGSTSGGQTGSVSLYLPKLKTCETLLSNGTTFSSKLNPTGDPLGGGDCYSKVVDKTRATKVVNNKDALILALTSAVSGDIVYVDDESEINLSSVSNITIPAGVTLASGRGGRSGLKGALLYSDTPYFDGTESGTTSLLVAGGENVRITGLRLRGPNPEMHDHLYNQGSSRGIFTRFSKIEIDNNEIYNFDNRGVWLQKQEGAKVHHNYIHHDQLAGLGYGVWLGGTAEVLPATAIIEANIFEACRSCIGSSGHEKTWEARYNVFMPTQLYQTLDRHSQSTNHFYGGDSTIVHHNLFLSFRRHLNLAYPLSSTGEVKVYDNWFRKSICDIGEIGSWTCAGATLPRVLVSNNFFNEQGRSLPVAQISASAISGEAPLKVNFGPDGSYSLFNHDISRFSWKFGDGDYTGNESRAKRTSYTFTNPGVYQVGLTVFDSYGVPSKTAYKTITVLPKPTPTYYLSAWVKDSYELGTAGHYEKQVLVNDHIVWRDDIAGDEGWQHVGVDVSSFTNPAVQNKIQLRIAEIAPTTKGTYSEVHVWFDDASVIGSSGLKDFSFEQNSGWVQKFYSGIVGTSANIGSDYDVATSRSGEYSVLFRVGNQSASTSGNRWGEMWQYFK